MSEPTPVRYSVTIMKPRQEVYDFWRKWDNLPRFSRHLKSVEDLGNGHTRWTAEGPAGEVVWEAVTTEDTPGSRIAWEATEALVWNSGQVEFKDAPGGRGTELHANMVYVAPGGAMGKAIALATGTEPEQEVDEAIRRFKAILECGELPINEGQPSNQMRKESMPGDLSKKVGLR